MYGWGWRAVIRSVAISGRFILHDKTGWGGLSRISRMLGSAAASAKVDEIFAGSAAMQIYDNIERFVRFVFFFWYGV